MSKFKEALQVVCPKCYSVVGALCTSVVGGRMGGKRLSTVHNERLQEVKRRDEAKISVHDMHDVKLKFKVLPKKEVAQIKAGTWIEVWWLDSPNTALLLLEKMSDAAGEVSLHCFDPTLMLSHHQATNRQVVAILGNLTTPALNCLADKSDD